MTRYEKLKDNPKKFLALTGYTPEEFSELFPCFSKCFLEFVQTHTLDGKRREKRRYTPYKNSCFDTIEEMLLFILIYLRKAMTQDVLGELFGMSQPLANRWIHLLLPILNQALAELGELPSRATEPTTFSVASDTTTDKQRSSHFFHDSTERPIQRPKDPQTQKAYYSGKKKQHTIKNNLIINADSKVVLLTPSCEGSIHDKRAIL